MKILSFNPAKHYLGSVCKHGHDWNNTGCSLRWRNKGGCVTCDYSRWGTRKTIASFYLPLTKQIAPEIDTSQFYLGELCSRLHNWKSTDYSLCYISARRCVQCCLEDSKTYQKEHRELYAKLARGYRIRHPEKLAAYDRRYRQTEAGKEAHRRKGHKYRAKIAASHFIQVTREDISSRLQEFNNCCAYCEKPGTLTIDHFICLSSGGTHTLSNLLPACPSCNFHKQAIAPDIWYKRQPFFTPKRWRKILKALGKTEHNVDQLPLF